MDAGSDAAWRRAAFAAVKGSTVVHQLDVMDSTGKVFGFDLLRRHQRAPADAVHSFCAAHDFRPLDSCKLPLLARLQQLGLMSDEEERDGWGAERVVTHASIPTTPWDLVERIFRGAPDAVLWQRSFIAAGGMPRDFSLTVRDRKQPAVAVGRFCSEHFLEISRDKCIANLMSGVDEIDGLISR